MSRRKKISIFKIGRLEEEKSLSILNKIALNLKMEKLLASKKIQMLPMVDTFESEFHIAYTKKLLELNVLIEFYGMAVCSDLHISEDVAIFANLRVNDSIHSYVLFVSNEVLGPLPIMRIIADAIAYIEGCPNKTLIEDLKEIATSYSIIDNKIDNKEFYENAIWKHESALQLIK